MSLKKNIKEALDWVRILKSGKEFFDTYISKSLESKRVISRRSSAILNGFVGQKLLLSNIKNMIAKSADENLPMGHILLHGPPGFGKTTIAKGIAESLNTNLIELSGPMVSISRLRKLISQIRFGDIVFIDEIHGMNRKVEESFYEVMQDFSLEGIEVPAFTLVGATTRPGSLSKPFRDRFQNQYRLEPYSDDELLEMVSRILRAKRVKTTKQGAMLVVNISRGTPRLLSQYMTSIINASESKSLTTSEIEGNIRNVLGLTEDGLTKRDLEYLRFLSDKNSKGLSTIATALGEQDDDLVNSIEPYLVKIGAVLLTKQGRIITDIGLEKIR